MDVLPGRLTGIYKNSLGIVALVLECTPVGGQLQTSDESTEVTWIETKRLGQLAGERIRIRIEDALAGIPVPAVRDHSHVAQSAR